MEEQYNSCDNKKNLTVNNDLFVLNINELCSTVFLIIIKKFLKRNNWRKLLPLRLVCKKWRNNIDLFLSSRSSFKYTGKINNESEYPVMNYFEFDSILNFYPNLKQLFVENFKVSDHFSAIISRKIRKLEKLSLRRCQNISWRGFAILSINLIHLKFIDVSYCNLEEKSLAFLAERLKNLITLIALNPGVRVTGEFLGKLGPNIRNLSISLSHLRNCNTALDALVSGNGKYLTSLNLAVNNYENIKWTFISDMVKLKSLQLTFGSNRNSPLFDTKNLLNLEILILAEASRNEKACILTDESILSMLRNCSKLKSIGFASSKNSSIDLTGKSLGQLSNLCKNLQEIRLINAHKIYDHCLTQLGLISSLVLIDLTNMNSITDIGIINLVIQSKTIKDIHIDTCPFVTENIINSFIEIATIRPKNKLNLYLSGMKITKPFEKLPKNLSIICNER